MDYIKSPYNWVGNKYKYLDIINSFNFEQYEHVIDVMMGSGNILFNIIANGKNYVGNDKQGLLPDIYNLINKNDIEFNLSDIDNVLNRFNRFSTKESYYVFRDYWNKKYLNNIRDRIFCVETALLLKMCSNSMVRFNPTEGYFNQGFRGLGKKKEFFTDQMKSIIVNGLNNLQSLFNDKKFYFLNEDFEYCITRPKDRSLLIIDPPYILRKDMYDTDFSKEDDERLLELLKNTRHDFIYFNYLQRENIVNESLNNFINSKSYKVIDINNGTMAGQGRSKNIKEVREVIITNV